jgi:predicted transcriptional regulator
MRQRSVLVFTEKEEEFVNLLTRIGIRKGVAQMLVILANTPEATSRDIERGTDRRQPEVSPAIKYLNKRRWIKTRLVPSEEEGGRAVKSYSLAVPMEKILDVLKKRKYNDANSLALIGKMRGLL